MDWLVYTSGVTYVAVICMYFVGANTKTYRGERIAISIAFILFLLLGAQLLALAYLAWAVR